MGYLLGIAFELARNEDVRAKQGIERPGVGPPTVHDAVRDIVSIDVCIINVCDFELAAAGRFECPDDIEYRDHRQAQEAVAVVLVPVCHALNVTYPPTPAPVRQILTSA